ncbi:MAG: OmpA family protein [Chitinophagales bacterium]|nr:OmpA family protein [Chitinophagales bacterium]
MRNFTKFGTLVILLLLSTWVIAQDSGKNKKKTKAAKEESVVEEVKDPQEVQQQSEGEGKKGKSLKGDSIKDAQNQTQFMQPDMESDRYNFYQRRGISTPLMMRYDQEGAPYQKGKKKEKQQQAYLSNQYYFPSKPKDMWELGINFGSAFVSGDVKPYVNIKGLIQNIGVGATIRKSIGYFASLRFGYNYMMTTGRNWEADENLQFNPALTGRYDPNVNYWNNPRLNKPNTTDNINMNKVFFYNYRTYVHEAHLAAVINIGNIRFHKERNVVNFYLLAGVSAAMTTTYVDALNENNDVYDFSNVYSLYINSSGNPNYVNDRLDRRKEALKRLDKILDGKYETLAEHENNVPGIKNWQFLPAGTVGAGVQFHVSKWVTLGLEQRLIFTGSDLLDGYRWQQDAHAGFTRNLDNLSYTSIGIFFHLGNPKKRTEPMFWLNPVYHPYKKLGDVDPKAVKDDILKDDDDDGVINQLDKEPNTKPGCPVDTKGVSLDSDKDGIIDCEDAEPFSPPGYPVDSAGKAIIPPNPCCDTTGFSEDGAFGPDGPGGPGGPGGINKGKKGSGGYDCAKIELPSVVFDEDKYYLDPQYFGNLHQIAERMQMCPDMRLVVTGYDESRNDQKYNEQLSWNRANAAVDYLVEKYGISRDRFIVKYVGGKKAASGTAYEKKMKNKVEFRYANDGEAGSSNPPAPHPGLKAGSNK